jgi:hypothetical protein
MEDPRLLAKLWLLVEDTLRRDPSNRIAKEVLRVLRRQG